jgi:hypothetical protein
MCGLGRIEPLTGAVFATIVVVALAGCTSHATDQLQGTSNAPGRFDVAGISLVPAPRRVRRACVKAARHLKVGIYCPTLVPIKWGTQMLVCAGCNGTFSATGVFPAPRDYVGSPEDFHAGHFTVWAATPSLIQQGYVGCTDGRISGRSHFAGLGMTWIVCPPGSELDSGHVLLEWSRGGWIYGLSLHSATATNRRLLRVIAAHVIRLR